MPVSINRLWCRESVFVESLHEDELLGTGNSGQIEPIELGSAIEVVSILLNSPETCTSESSKLEDNDPALFVLAQVNI
jgi:hypothetical protein